MGDTSGTVNVDYVVLVSGDDDDDGEDQNGSAFVPCANISGVAEQNCDYTITSGTLTFGPNETSKDFVVLITEDVYSEGNETIGLILRNPTGGATLGTQRTATLMILDDDSGIPESNPSDTPGAFVRQHYADFLNRLSDQAGLAYWTSQLAQCGNDQTCMRNRRIAVSDAFAFEPEFQETAAYVYRVYKAAFGAKPTYAQFMPDRARVIGGSQLEQSKADFARIFVQRAVFAARYPNSLSAGQYVDALNTNTGNSLTTTQRDALVAGMTNGSETRGSVLSKIADNQFFINREYNASFVLTEYFAYLRRDPDAAGYNFWLGQVNSFPLRDIGIQHAMVCSFITSVEYQQRFSSVATHGNGECPR